MEKMAVNSDISINKPTNSYLSKEDEQDLKELYELHKAGKLEFCTLDEVMAFTDEIIAKYECK